MARHERGQPFARQPVDRFAFGMFVVAQFIGERAMPVDRRFESADRLPPDAIAVEQDQAIVAVRRGDMGNYVKDIELVTPTADTASRKSPADRQGHDLHPPPFKRGAAIETVDHGDGSVGIEDVPGIGIDRQGTGIERDRATPIDRLRAGIVRTGHDLREKGRILGRVANEPRRDDRRGHARQSPPPIPIRRSAQPGRRRSSFFIAIDS
ncbi:hypothetical protein EKN06_06480 [Croceicoccus ponticola]|uniref:Uncharacterized protein n=1 Tax=Croceicoccus ponticola TaxID=2217664 RepID=A0A437GYS0_9SPHN|nr:hypothetical protein EKN06_06480 [Croceicoccus ponticola]